MLSLSTTTGYAIKALVCLAENNGEPMLIKDISLNAGVPAPYLAKITRRLAVAEIVNSKRGYKGGVQLRRSPADITVLDIGKAIDGEDVVGSCLLGKVFCASLSSCPTHPFWEKTAPEIECELSRWTLSDMAAFSRQCSADSAETAGGISEGAGI